MKNNLLEQISSKVYTQFPETAGVKPQLKVQKGDPGVYLLLFKTEMKLPGGQKMVRIVRVVANDAGQVLKMSTSKG